MNNQDNRLSKEKSPYLLQHSTNPVDWHPWGNEAFAKALREDKPVFLSIGYSTCHWCHVMAHESFEDAEVARLLNETFVSIKVDREERPDIDNIYMSVCTMLTGSGGWPLTIIMTPDKKPFFAATYIQKESKWGRVGLLDLIPRIREIWAIRRDDAYKSAEEITALLNRDVIKKTGQMDKSIFDEAYALFKSSYDSRNGGFGNAPKFPSPHNLLFLLRYWHRFKEEHSLQMVSGTLKKMRLGGIFDHIGLGFHRYSTDPEWLVPHFEKMLYDQAMLAIAYAEAYQATKDEFFAITAAEILEYVLRDMVSPQGGFYSAEDADSEGSEGKFYVWTQSEIENLLNNDDADLAAKVFNIGRDGNFLEESIRQKTGKNILHLKDDMRNLAQGTGLTIDELKRRLEDIREKLFSARGNRVHPYKDDKILTDWNGLMIAALGRAGRILNNAKYTKAAEKAVEFIKKNLWLSGGRLLHRYREGEAGIPGNLDDYAFLAWGLIELYQSMLNAEYLKAAILLSEAMITHFADERDGLFYFTPDDGEELITRTKILYDGAIPSGNSIAFYNLIRLGRLTGNQKWSDYANKLSLHAFPGAKQNPSGYAMFLVGFDMAMSESPDIVIAGNPDDIGVGKMLSGINEHFLPNITLILHPIDKKNIVPLIEEIAPYIKPHTAIDGKATAYICKNYTCSHPTNDIREMMRLLLSK